MSKPLRAGGEVDSYCTKCRLVLNHRIIAMVGPLPKKVECSTCNSHHTYRPYAPGQKPEPGARGAAAGGLSRSKSTSEPRAARVSHVTRAAAAAMEREKTWERATTGKGLAEFKRYDVGATFREGELVRHTKFGDGVVIRILDARKVEVMFKDETRTLAQGLTA
jgi:hypothetical protein